MNLTPKQKEAVRRGQKNGGSITKPRGLSGRGAAGFEQVIDNLADAGLARRVGGVPRLTRMGMKIA